MSKLTKSGGVSIEELKDRIESQLGTRYNLLLKGARLEVVKGALRGCVVKVKQKKWGDTDIYFRPFAPALGLAIAISLLCIGIASLLILFGNLLLGIILLAAYLLVLLLPLNGLVNEVKNAIEKPEKKIMRIERLLPFVAAFAGSIVLPVFISYESVIETFRTGFAKDVMGLGYYAELGGLQGFVVIGLACVILVAFFRKSSRMPGDQLKSSFIFRFGLFAFLAYFLFIPTVHLISTIQHVILLRHYTPKYILGFDVLTRFLLFNLSFVVALQTIRTILPEKRTYRIAAFYFFTGFICQLARFAIISNEDSYVQNNELYYYQNWVFMHVPNSIGIALWGLVASIWFVWIIRSSRQHMS